MIPSTSHRFIIDFFDLDLDHAKRWPELLTIVRQKVKPDRDYQKRKALRARWWQYAEKRPGLYRAIAELDSVLVTGSQAAAHFAFARLPARMVFSSNLNVFPFDTYAAFGALQSRPHEVWARFFGSTMKDDLSYTPTTCFETFPFSTNFYRDTSLSETAEDYYEFRAQLMATADEGLTRTYNRFHDPGEQSPEILKLRALHDAIDRAVLDAYGWTDIQPTCEFLLDFEEADEEDGDETRRRKPWRYRWPDDVRDEVLARLLALNQERAEEERLAGQSANAEPRGSTRSRRGRAQARTSNESLFEGES
jgi:hypothetical protein